jgi:DNA-binding NarL/FixJ family response regulator
MPKHLNQPNENIPSILIVEDHDELRKRLHIWLELIWTQHQIIDAPNAEEALRIIADRSPILVIMDILLPEMNGIEATRVIKQMQPDTNVIVMTHLPANGYQESALKAGADVFICKDVLFRELIPAMEKLL